MKLKSSIDYSFKQVPSPVLCPQGIHFQKAAGLGKELAVGAYDDVATGKFLLLRKGFESQSIRFLSGLVFSLFYVTFIDMSK